MNIPEFLMGIGGAGAWACRVFVIAKQGLLLLNIKQSFEMCDLEYFSYSRSAINNLD